MCLKNTLKLENNKRKTSHFLRRKNLSLKLLSSPWAPLLCGKNVTGKDLPSTLRWKASLIHFQNIPQSPSKLSVNAFLVKTLSWPMTLGKMKFYNLPAECNQEERKKKSRKHSSGLRDPLTTGNSFHGASLGSSLRRGGQFRLPAFFISPFYSFSSSHKFHHYTQLLSCPL